MADPTEDKFEYVTIVGESFDEVAEECRAQRLHENEFAIVHPIQRHRFAMAGNAAGLDGRNLVTATFARRTSN